MVSTAHREGRPRQPQPCGACKVAVVAARSRRRRGVVRVVCASAAVALLLGVGRRVGWPRSRQQAWQHAEWDDPWLLSATAADTPVHTPHELVATQEDAHDNNDFIPEDANESEVCDNFTQAPLLDTWRAARVTHCTGQRTVYRYEAWYDVTHPTLYDVQLRVGAGNNVSTKINATTECNVPARAHADPGRWFAELKFIADLRLYEHEPCHENNTLSRVLLLVDRFDTSNPYEAMHCYLNAFLVLAMLRITHENVQVAFNDDKAICAQCFDTEFWTTMFPNFPPLELATRGHRHECYARQIMMPSPGVSLLVSQAPGARLHGRGHPHHCRSSLLMGFAAWVVHGFGKPLPMPRNDSTNIALKQRGRRRWRVLWAVRGEPYSRTFPNQSKVTRAVREALGPAFDVIEVDFAKRDMRSSIRTAHAADVIVGAHGANLAWSLFMRRHESGVVELFGSNRGPENHHYHNMASLVDLHYAALELCSYGVECGPSYALFCDAECVAAVASAVEGIVDAIANQTEPSDQSDQWKQGGCTARQRDCVHRQWLFLSLLKRSKRPNGTKLAVNPFVLYMFCGPCFAACAMACVLVAHQPKKRKSASKPKRECKATLE